MARLTGRNTQVRFGDTDIQGVSCDWVVIDDISGAQTEVLDDVVNVRMSLDTSAFEGELRRAQDVTGRLIDAMHVDDVPGRLWTPESHEGELIVRTVNFTGIGHEWEWDDSWHDAWSEFGEYDRFWLPRDTWPALWYMGRVLTRLGRRMTHAMGPAMFNYFQRIRWRAHAEAPWGDWELLANDPPARIELHEQLDGPDIRVMYGYLQRDIIGVECNCGHSNRADRVHRTGCPRYERWVAEGAQRPQRRRLRQPRRRRTVTGRLSSGPPIQGIQPISPYIFEVDGIQYDRNLTSTFVRHMFELFGGDYGDEGLGAANPIVASFSETLPDDDDYDIFWESWGYKVKLAKEWPGALDTEPFHTHDSLLEWCRAEANDLEWTSLEEVDTYSKRDRQLALMKQMKEEADGLGT